MTNTTKKTFSVTIKPDQCKGCERCVNACPRSVLTIGNEFNRMGLQYAVYEGNGCIGCGACFYTCPEPGAITVYEITEDGEED
jgi:NAD-dependent dihydropyrimidine dehydrogenase PreA subunit